MGLYHASKWALEGFTQSLAAEVKPFGIKVSILEPFAFGGTALLASADMAEKDPAYDQARAALNADGVGAIYGDPHATRQAVLSLVDAAEPPLRLLLGKGALDVVRAEYQSRVAVWEDWEAVTEAAQG
jgi:NAD(P)-dependent dehydrogenase (short-subunit alcohol dehydrogenase family)